MNVSQKIKDLRNQQGWSQEKLAEKLGVSRQAVTKWETGAGTPDIENLAALARVFGVTTDELLFGVEAQVAPETACESITAFDLEREKNYEFEVGCARIVSLRTTTAEKLQVRLVSKTIDDVDRAVKVYLDTSGRNLSIRAENQGVIADALLRRELDVIIDVPTAFSESAELTLNAQVLSIKDVRMDVEVGGQVTYVLLSDVEGHVELDLTGNVEAWADDVRGKLDLNQIGAVSILHVTEGTAFSAHTKGLLGRRTLLFSRDGGACEVPATEDAPLSIELAGARAELTVDVTTTGIPTSEQLCER